MIELYDEVKYSPSGDKALVMEFGNAIDPSINAKIRNVLNAIKKADLTSIEEIIPTYRSLLIIYNPLLKRYKEMVEELKKLEGSIGEEASGIVKIFEIPTTYGGEYGPDIEFVAQHNNLTIEEVIDIHTSTNYLIYMLGFTPGFTYLGGLDKRIETPRLENPRTKIPAGSTGIAGKQTGIYPIESPGGWQLIGRTPVKLYDPFNDPPVILSAGDYVRFVRIDEEEFLKIKNEVEKGTYEVVVREEVDNFA